MSDVSKSKTGRRKKSDLGKVFPSGVRIGKASYGYGVFAFAFIPKGTPIARVSGRIIQDADYSSDYCIDAGDDKVLEPEPPFCYLNHSCEPNCQLMHYVEEAEDGEDLETGELSAEEMDLDTEEENWEDGDCIYGGEEEEEEADDGQQTAAEDDEDAEEEQYFEDDSDAEIWVETIADILPDEELTIDYCWPADRAAKCLCGKPTCRGWIVDPSERHLLEES